MTFKETFNFLLILILLIVPVIVSINFGEVSASISLIAISFAIVFWNLEKFSKFKGAGFEAELRIAVDKTYAAIEEVKKLAISLSSPVASLLAIKNAFQYLKLKEKLIYVKEIEASLRELNIDEKEINKATSILYDRVKDDHLRKILWSMNNKLEETDKIFKSYEDIVPSDWDIDKIVKKSSELNIDVNEEIKEYNYFIKTKELLNVDEWQG